MSAELNENEFDLSQKAVGISIGGSGSGQTQIGGSGGSGSGGSGGSGSGGSGGSGSGGNGGSGSGGSGGSGSGGSGGSGSGGNGGSGSGGNGGSGSGGSGGSGSGGSGGSGSGGSGGSGSGGSGGSGSGGSGGSGSGGSGGSGSGGNGGSGSGGNGGSGSGGNGGSGSGGNGGSGSGGNGGENGNGGDEQDGEENPAEEQEEGDSEDEQNSQNDSRLGQRCVIIYPEEFAGRLGNIKRVIFKGKPDTPIQPRNINGYTITYPSETEFTLFEVEYINKNGKLEEGSFMDIDVLFENQDFFRVSYGNALGEVCEGFVESDTSPNEYLIQTENGLIFLASSCFISLLQLNTQNQNNSEDGESDEDEDTQDNEQENSIVGKEFVLLRDSGTHKSGERGTILSSLGERMLEGTEKYVVNGLSITYPIGTYYSAYFVAIGEDRNFIILDFDFVLIGDVSVNFVISHQEEYGLKKGTYMRYGVIGFLEDSPQKFLLELNNDNPSLIEADMCFVSLETIAIRNQRQDSQDDDDDDDDDEQTPENEENVFVASLFWNYVLNERKLSGDVFTADIDENFREVTNQMYFLRNFPASLYDESVIYSKETKEYGYLTTNEFNANTIQTIDYFALTNFNLFESVIYRNNPKELNFTYVALKYVLDNLRRKMFFVPTYQVNEESFYVMVYEKSEDEIIVVTNYEKFSVRKNGLGDYLHLIVLLMINANLSTFEQNLFLDFKKQTQNLLKPNIFYAKIFEDYCKALTI